MALILSNGDIAIKSSNIYINPHHLTTSSTPITNHPDTNQNGHASTHHNTHPKNPQAHHQFPFRTPPPHRRTHHLAARADSPNLLPHRPAAGMDLDRTDAVVAVHGGAFIRACGRAGVECAGVVVGGDLCAVCL